MVGRLVEEEKVRLFEKQPAQRHPPALTAGQLFHHGVVGRAAQRVHRLVDLGVEIPQPLGLDLVLQLGHLVGGFVGIIGGELVVAVDDRLLRRQALHHVFAHGFCRIELRLLRQIADAGARRRPGLPGILGVEPGHDAKQRRFAGTVDAKDADLGVGIEGQVDVLQDLAVGGIGLGQTLHVIDELTGHLCAGLSTLPLFHWRRFARASCTDSAVKALISGKTKADVATPAVRGKRRGARRRACRAGAPERIRFQF